MQRTNIYLEDKQLDELRLLSTVRQEPVAKMVREAVDGWLKTNGLRRMSREEWERRFDAFMEERRRIADEAGWTDEEVERDVLEAVREVRRERREQREHAAASRS